MSEKTQVIVVGGGASGLMAAIVAAENGAAVTVLKRQMQFDKQRHASRYFQRPASGICGRNSGTVYAGGYTCFF